MYSVLIQNQKTYESFQKFHPLFLESLSKDEIGSCRWIESGDTIDTALPELKELVEEKENWRAIVVHVENEESMSKFETMPMNPYDFKINHNGKTEYKESEVPLVRLSHLLGGIPSPEIEYVTEEVKDGGKDTRVIYKPVVSNEKNKIYKKLMEKYDFNGKKPVEIIFIRIRNISKISKMESTEIWKNYHEIQSSNFWKTNNYSNRSRFVLYDMKKAGKMEYEADMFKFWLSVLLLATNTVNPDELQAYRLYNANLNISKTKLNKAIQNFYLRLSGEKKYIEQIVQTELNKQLSEKTKLPNYRLDVPVNLEIPKVQDLNISKKEFSLLSSSLETDLKKWDSLKQVITQRIRDSLKQSDRALDDSADRMRNLCSMRESEVLRLNKYQKRELKDELSALYESIITLQRELPDTTNYQNQNVLRAADKVKNWLRLRLDNEQIKFVFSFVLPLIFMSVLPGIIYMNMNGIDSSISCISIFLLLLDLIIIVVFLVLYSGKKKLDEKLGEYNNAVNDEVNKILHNSGLYSTFLSGIASHSRGHSYLKILEYKKFALNNLEETIQKHNYSIDLTLMNLEKWQKAFYLTKEKDFIFVDESYFDITVPPISNKIYTFEYGNKYQIPINSSGAKIVSPFNFVEKFILTREEMYEDGNN